VSAKATARSSTPLMTIKDDLSPNHFVPLDWIDAIIAGVATCGTGWSRFDRTVGRSNTVAFNTIIRFICESNITFERDSKKPLYLRRKSACPRSLTSLFLSYCALARNVSRQIFVWPACAHLVKRQLSCDIRVWPPGPSGVLSSYSMWKHAKQPQRV